MESDRIRKPRSRNPKIRFYETDLGYPPIPDPPMTALTQTPQHRTCRTCQATTITALDHHRAAITTHLDPYPLTPQGEVWALQHHRPTYHATPTHHTRRDKWNMRNNPPSTHLTVLTWHQCDQPPPPHHRRPTNPPATRPPTKDDTCPF